MSRNPARKGKADSNQPAITQAIQALGYPVMDLSAAGNGVEDLLVGLHKRTVFPGQTERALWWIVVECKVPPVKFTVAQIEWRRLTEAWPRITVTSAQDAVDQIRAMTG